MGDVHHPEDAVESSNTTETAVGATSAGPPSWRVISYSMLAVLTFLYLTATVVLFYTRRARIADIRYRPLRLNILNTVATIMLCVMFCLRTAFWPNHFPCILIFWPAYMGFFLWCTAVICRVLSFAWVARFNLAKIRMSSHYGDVNSNSLSPAAPQTPTTPFTPSHDGQKLGIRRGSAALLKRFRRLKHCATDKWLARMILYPVMVLGFILCLVLQFTAPGLSLKPLRKTCELGFEALPLLVLLGFFLVVICPVLCYLLYDVRDAYGVRNELITAIVCGNMAYIGFFVIEKALPDIRDYIGSYLLAWVALMVCHTLSITLPVVKSFKKKRPNAGGAALSRMSSYSSQISVIKSRKYNHFLDVLANPTLFSMYKGNQASVVRSN